METGISLWFGGQSSAGEGTGPPAVGRAVLEGAVGGAAVASRGIAVVALLARFDAAVAAGSLDAAVGGAAVASRGIAVVALLAGIEGAVAAARLERAVGGAAVAAGGVAVVALLAGIEGAVAAARLERAVGGAAIAAGGVAVVALFVAVGHPVAAPVERRDLRLVAVVRFVALVLRADEASRVVGDHGDAAALEAAFARGRKGDVHETSGGEGGRREGRSQERGGTRLTAVERNGKAGPREDGPAVADPGGHGERARTAAERDAGSGQVGRRERGEPVQDVLPVVVERLPRG